MLSAVTVDASVPRKRAGSGGPPARDSREAIAWLRYGARGVAAFAAPDSAFPTVGPAKRCIVSDATRAITPLAVRGAVFTLFAGDCGFFLTVSSPLRERTEMRMIGRVLNIDCAV